MSQSEPPQIIDTPFVNEFRLTAWHWICAFFIVLIGVLLLPRIWKKIEQFAPGPDYRLPYNLSKDYWLYERRLHDIADPTKVILLGDSVVWGEYVLPDGTLSHFLNQQAGQPDKFVNGGVNGLFPLALEGLVNHYGSALRQRKVLVQCNVLWMSSPKADLRVEKEEKFNHSRLVPQFRPRIPCYKADANERLSAVVERNVGLVAWVNHLQSAYFDEKSILSWTLQDDGNDPPHYPNTYKNPFGQITLTVPSPPQNDPQRGPTSPRHKAWSESGTGTTQFEWVDPEMSLQWAAFQRLVKTLRSNGNEVLVIRGPFNEYMMAKESGPAYRRLGTEIDAWFAKNQIPQIAPEVLPSELYADASHPLTQGYQLLAGRLYQDPAFQKWFRK
ncbi:MAG: hypothetical protein ABI651_08880 [Verrucomicrobiota bacterium]